jgi:TonB family protein
MKTIAHVLAAWCLGLSLGAQDGLSVAQALYADARYEEALKAFDALRAAGDQAPRAALAVEQGRAFCLLALDRRADAQLAIESIVRLNPAYSPAEDDTSPKIRAAFRDVRRRTLVDVLQQVYERAKLAYERKAFDEAAAGFGQALALLADSDLAIEPGPRADMRLVSKAFEDLAKAASVSAQPSNSSSGPATSGGVAATDGIARPQGTAAGPLYDAASKDVSAPVPERTDVRIPESLRRSGPTGEVFVELVLSATGTVESATVRQSPDAVFSALVARAAMDWRYRPASKAGVPVRYRLIAKVVVSRLP